MVYTPNKIVFFFLETNTQAGDIQSFSLYKRGSKLTHLLFVDDGLLFIGLLLMNVQKFWIFWTPMRKLWAKKWTKIRRQFSLVNPLQRAPNNILRMLWVCRRLHCMKIFGTSVFCWEGEKGKLQLHLLLVSMQNKIFDIINHILLNWIWWKV